MRINFPNEWYSCGILVTSLEQALEVELALNEEYPHIEKYSDPVFGINEENFAYWKKRAIEHGNDLKVFIYSSYNGYGIVNGEGHTDIPFNFTDKRKMLRQTIRKLRY